MTQAGSLVASTSSILSTVSSYVSAGIGAAADYMGVSSGSFIASTFLPQLAPAYAGIQVGWSVLSGIANEVATDYTNLQSSGYGSLKSGLYSVFDVLARPVEWIALNAIWEGRNRQGEDLSLLERVGYGAAGTVGTVLALYPAARGIQLGIFAGVASLGAGSAAGGLVQAELAEAASSNLAQAGLTVLGKVGYEGVPGYAELGEELGANIFKLKSATWDAMSPAERIAANQRFLDAMIARGDQIILSSNANLATGMFKWEIDYLRTMGYRLSNDGWRIFLP